MMNCVLFRYVFGYLKLFYISLISGLFFFISDLSAQELDKHRISDSLFVLANENIEKFRKGDVEVTLVDKNGIGISDAHLEINQISHDFLFGNLSEEIFRDNISKADFDKFAKHFTDLFNFTEVTVKWAPYEPKQGHPQWQKLNEKIAWAKANNITVKGHTLGWTHEAGTPTWLQKYPVDQANILYEARIKNLVGGFRDDIQSWDVVNEPINTIPWERALLDTLSKDGKIDDGYRYNTQGITLKETFPWVKKSIDWAYEANPNGDFIVNEFYVIAKPDVREQFFNLIDTLIATDTRVTGIGIQAHEPRDRWFSPLEVMTTFDRLYELGLPLHITEFTPQSAGMPITGGWREGIWNEGTQAEFAVEFYTLAFGHPGIESIHWWGLSDRWIWLKGGGLLDENLDPKPVYHQLRKLIKEKWMTKALTVTTNSEGAINFRGFYGKYEVVIVLPDGKKIHKQLHLKKGENTQLQLEI